MDTYFQHERLLISTEKLMKRVSAAKLEPSISRAEFNRWDSVLQKRGYLPNEAILRMNEAQITHNVDLVKSMMGSFALAVSSAGTALGNAMRSMAEQWRYKEQEIVRQNLGGAYFNGRCMSDFENQLFNFQSLSAKDAQGLIWRKYKKTLLQTFRTQADETNKLRAWLVNEIADVWENAGFDSVGGF